MAKSRDYLYRDVLNIKGEKIGYIKDLLIDFNKSEVVGFKINSYKIMKRGFNVLKDDIIYQKDCLVVRGITKNTFVELSTIINMYVVDKSSNIIGLVSELIFDEYSFEIKGFFIKDYNLWNILKSRKVMLISEVIMGEDYIFYVGENERIVMECLPIGRNMINSYRDIYYEKA